MKFLKKTQSQTKSKFCFKLSTTPSLTMTDRVDNISAEMDQNFHKQEFPTLEARTRADAQLFVAKNAMRMLSQNKQIKTYKADHPLHFFLVEKDNPYFEGEKTHFVMVVNTLSFAMSQTHIELENHPDKNASTLQREALENFIRQYTAEGARAAISSNLEDLSESIA